MKTNVRVARNKEPVRVFRSYSAGQGVSDASDPRTQYVWRPQVVAVMQTSKEVVLRGSRCPTQAVK